MAAPLYQARPPLSSLVEKQDRCRQIVDRTKQFALGCIAVHALAFLYLLHRLPQRKAQPHGAADGQDGLLRERLTIAVRMALVALAVLGLV